MSEKPKRDLDALIKDGALFDRAVAQAQADAARRHRAAGVPLVVWQDGRVVEIPPNEIVVPGEHASDEDE